MAHATTQLGHPEASVPSGFVTDVGQVVDGDPQNALHASTGPEAPRFYPQPPLALHDPAGKIQGAVRNVALQSGDQLVVPRSGAYVRNWQLMLGVVSSTISLVILLTRDR